MKNICALRTLNTALLSWRATPGLLLLTNPNETKTTIMIRNTKSDTTNNLHSAQTTGYTSWEGWTGPGEGSCGFWGSHHKGNSTIMQ